MQIGAQSPSSSQDSGSNPGEADIAIVGGGMVGISLAILLAEANPRWRITLIESFPISHDGEIQYQSSFDARSTALSAGSRMILEGCGLWPSLREHLTCIRRVHVSDKDHFGGSTIEAREHGLDAVGYVVENAWLGKVLMARLRDFPQIQCRAPASVIEARATVDGYRLELQEGQERNTVECQLLVLADGADSKLRKQLGIAVQKTDYRQSGLIANVQSDRPHRGVAYERFTAKGPVALLPMGESDDSGTLALVWTRPRDQARTLLHCSDEEFLERLQRDFGHRQGRFTQVSSRHLYPLELCLAKEQVRRSLVLMGNAAHFLHPVAGQGFNLALRDCEALTGTLAAGVASGRSLNDLGLLESYLQSQSRDQWATIQLSDNFVRWFSSRAPGKSVLRNLGLFALDLLPPAKRQLARQTMGLT